jgi:hypothetical protein
MLTVLHEPRIGARSTLEATVNIRNGLMLLLLLGIGTACSENDQFISIQIEKRLEAANWESLDLALVGPAQWETVCVLPPYTNNAQAKAILGFDWDAEGRTAIKSSDSINVLVFLREKKVLAFSEHSRAKGDFAELAPSCLPRAAAKVMRVGSMEPKRYVRANS